MRPDLHELNPPCGCRREAAAPGPGRRATGFTVLELLLAVSIMTVIIIGLYTVFDQTQKALRSTVSQVDVLEGMRATSDILVRDVEGGTAVSLANTNLASFAANANLFAVPVDLKGLGPTNILRTLIQDVYLVTKQNDFWKSIGFWVGPVNTNDFGQPFSVGRLYRFAYETNSAAFGFTNLFLRFQSPQRLFTSQPVMDGVVHFRVIASDAAGYPLYYDARDKPVIRDTRSESLREPRSWFIDPIRSETTAYLFRRGTHPQFPASIELEIGVLEPQYVKRFNAIPVASEARKFLSRNAGKIHMFRHLIPLRNSPPS